MNIETFAREVAKLKKQVGASKELSFYCFECGQPLKSYDHAQLIRQRNAADATDTRAAIQRAMSELAESMRGSVEA
jgi:transcription initiation factor IIE alpha subunit